MYLRLLGKFLPAKLEVYLIALQSLDVPSTLHRNLLSPNAIENSFCNTRGKLGRVTRFRAETDQATHWLAFALTEVEKGFRRISGYADRPKLIAALENKISPQRIPTGITVDHLTKQRP
jgi:hypothetical protein